MILQNSKNLWHLFLAPLHLKVAVICEYSIDFRETFTDGLDGNIDMQNLVNLFLNSKSYSKFNLGDGFLGPQCIIIIIIKKNLQKKI